MAVWIKKQQTSSKWSSSSSQNTFLRLKQPLHVFASGWITQVLKAQDSTWARYSGCSSCCKSSLQLICGNTCFRKLTFCNDNFNCESTWPSMRLSEGRLQPAVLILSMLGYLGASAWKPPKPHAHMTSLEKIKAAGMQWLLLITLIITISLLPYSPLSPYCFLLLSLIFSLISKLFGAEPHLTHIF